MSWAFFKINGSITSGMLATLDLTGAKEVFYYPGSAWFTPFIKALTKASRLNTALQVIQHMNDNMTMAEIGLGYNTSNTTQAGKDRPSNTVVGLRA